ncbi:carbon-nitrogen hydrolase family protein [Anaerosacchariphilus sp. NSJ-68]|uniref:Carbon-nitrogen hydrolase family protein n=2 Tax=Lachnospiraceae TaxID=186803 RepID=A0A923LCC8_9FIRM|nr:MULTISPECIES: carbon-nitrogen hydrolase family protein [Lachnospiraceae]MBC5659943.1 carbon-nitrogen hydrolase family protein [Anaerosacchariphilus hominis]MBC5697610.1 carbon-nitrogen hydrolase family protein [Roseburia difficilis]
MQHTCKLAMAQMRMTDSIEENLQKSLNFCDEAADSDLLFFPEIQLSPFFPQYEKRNADQWCMQESAPELEALQEKAAEHKLYLSPNVYLEQKGKRYDTSLFITPEGQIADRTKMVHIAQARQFYEQDYYTPSDEGFKVFDTPFGKIGIVICYDRHLPESVRTCVLKGADLILIPTANTKAEPLTMFEWEIRVQAMQNQVFIAMCNRVGREGGMDFAGESLVVHPSGDVIVKADDQEQLIRCELNLGEAREWREKVPYLGTRRPEWYL